MVTQDQLEEPRLPFKILLLLLLPSSGFSCWAIVGLTLELPTSTAERPNAQGGLSEPLMGGAISIALFGGDTGVDSTLLLLLKPVSRALLKMSRVDCTADGGGAGVVEGLPWGVESGLASGVASGSGCSRTGRGGGVGGAW